MKLYKRDIFDKIEPFLGDETVIVLHGARQVGKTSLLAYIQEYLEKQGKKCIYYDLEFPDVFEALNKSVHTFIDDLTGKGYLKGEEIFVLIDEVQYLDNPSSFLKIIADHYKNIHLIVSGSSTFDIKAKFKNSLAGRTIPFEIYPLTFSEFLTFKESEYVNISNLTLPALNRIKQYYSEFIKYGAYPRITLENDAEKKKRYLLQLVDTYIRKDIRDLSDITDVKKFNQMLKVLASQSGQLLSIKSLSSEVGISYQTIQRYLFILEETYVIKLVTPFSKSPSVEISKNPKIFFYDSGLASMLWLNNFQDTILGNIFETAVFGELVKKYGRNNIHFWRTKIGQEIDFVIEKDDLEILPVEVKTNFGQFSQKPIKTFGNKYKFKEWSVVGIEGEKKIKEYIYPWEIQKLRQ